MSPSCSHGLTTKRWGMWLSCQLSGPVSQGRCAWSCNLAPDLKLRDRDGAQHSVDAIDSQLRKIEGQSLGYKVARFFTHNSTMSYCAWPMALSACREIGLPMKSDRP